MLSSSAAAVALSVLATLVPVSAAASCSYVNDSQSAVLCPTEDFEALVDSSLDLEGDVDKLTLDVNRLEADLADARRALSLCTTALKASPKPRPWAKYGYGLGLVGAFALATAATVDVQPNIRVPVGVGGLSAMLVGYWIAIP